MGANLRVALVVIATGEKYWQFILPLLKSAQEFFPPHEVMLFTDCPRRFAAQQADLPDFGFPKATLYRYHAISEQSWLDAVDQIFYCDVDSLIVNPIKAEDVVSDGITATQHGGYVTNPSAAPFESRPQSKAFVRGGSAYYCGGFVGGRATAFMKMARHIRDRVDEDTRIGITAVWHDESHLNRYLHDNPPAKVLTPAFNYPPDATRVRYRAMWGRDYEPRVVCLEKAWKS